MSMPSSNWAARAFRRAFQKTFTNVFYSRFPPTRRRRSRRAAQQISLESLEPRQVLNGDTGWIKIDLSQLDQTGVGDAYDIYVQGNSAGMFIQPLDGKLMFARPQLGVDLTLPANSTWTFENPGALFVGGNVTFYDGTTSVGTAKIKSIAANVKVAAYSASNPLNSRWETTDVFNAFKDSGVTSKASVAINSGGIGTGTMENTGGIATLKDFNTPAAGSSVFTLGSVVVGNSPDYMFPNNNSQNDKTNGNGPSWTNPTYVTQIDNYSSSALTADASLSSKATGKLSSSLQVYQNGIGGQYATLPAIPTTSVPVSDANGKPVGQAVPLTIDNLLSTNQLPKTASPTYDANGVATISWQVQFQGNAADKPSSTGLLPVYSVDSYTVTFDSPAPANATQVTFHAQIGATIKDSQSFTIDTSPAGFPGLSSSSLFIGMPLVIAPGTDAASTAQVKALAAAGSTITVTLDNALPTQFTSSSPVTIALPPVGGTIPATKVDSSSSAANAIWVKQTTSPVVGEGNFSLNGSRIYFSLVPKGSQPQAMTWVSSGSGIAVNQWTPAQIWSGAVPASVYTELTVDDFSGTGGTGVGDVFFDLSGVDGFFFPAGISYLSYQNDAQTEWVVGQPWKNYSAPNTTGPSAYGPVTRSQLIAAFQRFFGSAAGNFSTDANALATQYQALVTKTSDAAVLGIKNPSFAYSSPTSSVPAFDTCWNPALDALFAQGNQIDMIGDDSDPSNSKTLYYKGMSTSLNSLPIIGVTATGKSGSVTYTLPQGSGPLIPGQTVTISGFANAALNGVFTLLSAPTATTFTVSNASVTQQTLGTAGTVTPSSYPYRFIQFTEYSGDYNSTSATGGVFYVFDPRTPPPSETAAFSGGTPMSVGYQVFGNTGVFASTQIVSGSPHPNSNGNSVLGSSALTQLEALQRDIVTALNRGMGGFGIGKINVNSRVPGASTNYWQTQNNWYPYAAPYGAQTPQNIYSQWFHTAVIAQAGQTYTVPATYPLGGAFGDPQKSWGGGVQSGTSGTGPYMNMYYGFGYDEKGRAPSNANTNAQFPGINNTAGNTLSFGVVLGPWDASTPTKPGSPTSVVATSGNKSLAVKWAAPASTGGSPITEYLVKYSSDKGKTWIRWGKTTVITATSCTIKDLTNGTAYVIKVIAVNAIGISLPSVNSAPATPAATVPSSPTSVVATSGNATLAVTWVAPVSDGGSNITDYLVKYSSNNGSTWKNFIHPVSTVPSLTVTGLANGTAYVIKVIARNAIGISLPSVNSAPATPAATVPSSPTSVVATSGNAGLAVSWTAPANTGGSAITEYLVKYSSNNGVAGSWTRYKPSSPITATACTVTGLTNGTRYVIKVIARNAVGISPPSANSAPIPVFTNVHLNPTSQTVNYSASQAQLSYSDNWSFEMPSRDVWNNQIYSFTGPSTATSGTDRLVVILTIAQGPVVAGYSTTPTGTYSFQFTNSTTSAVYTINFTVTS